MLVLPPSRWREWGERRDPSLADLADESGFIRPFEDWVESRASSIEPELSDEVLEAKRPMPSPSAFEKRTSTHWS
jgi:ABC-type uncharacterized transport system involved in gliding motility auxiliary subunit